MIQWKLFSRAVVALLITITVSACGFHLRGNIPLPDGIKNMYVVAPKGTFKDQVEKLLTNVDADLASSQAAADVVLNVTEAKVDRTLGTLDTRGKANSYNLEFSVTYQLEDPEGKVIRDASLREFRRYNFDPVQIIESESEEAELLENMEEAIALRIIRQLSSITDYPPVGEGK